MYGVSQKYKDAIYNNSRTIGWEGTVTLTDSTVINVGTDNMASGGLTVTRELYNNNMPWVGGTCAAQLDLSIISSQNRMALYGAKVEMSFVLYFDDGTNEKVPLGIYYVTEVERSSGDKINLTCFDAMQRFEVPAAVNVSGYAYDIIAYYCGICGVPLAQTREFIEEHFANTNVNLVSFVGDNSIATARQGLGYVLSIIGANAEIDRLGRLNLIADSTEEYETLSFSSANRFNTDISDFTVAITKIEAINPDTGDAISFGNEQPSGSNIGYSLNIGANPFLPTDENEIAAVVSTLFDSVRANPTTPFELKIPTNPAIDLGDHVAISVKSGMAVAIALGIIGKISYKTGGSMTISGIGVFPSENQTSNERTISGVNNEVRIGSIYYYDYVNASNVAIGDGSSETIMEINYGIGEATHIDFHGQAKLDVTTTETYDAQTETYTIGDCVVTATIYVDDVEQDFHPEWVLDDGENTIDFLHFYDIDTTGDASTLRVELSVDGGSVAILAGDALGYICGAHFADEVTALTIDRMPTKVNYHNGDRIDYSGIKVVATMKSAKRIDVTNSCEFDPAYNTLITGYEESETLNANVTYVDRANKTWRATVPLNIVVSEFANSVVGTGFGSRFSYLSIIDKDTLDIDQKDTYVQNNISLAGFTDQDAFYLVSSSNVYVFYNGKRSASSDSGYHTSGTVLGTCNGGVVFGFGNSGSKKIGKVTGSAASGTTSETTLGSLDSTARSVSGAYSFNNSNIVPFYASYGTSDSDKYYGYVDVETGVITEKWQPYLTIKPSNRASITGSSYVANGNDCYYFYCAGKYKHMHAYVNGEHHFYDMTSISNLDGDSGMNVSGRVNCKLFYDTTADCLVLYLVWTNGHLNNTTDYRTECFKIAPDGHTVLETITMPSYLDIPYESSADASTLRIWMNADGVADATFTNPVIVDGIRYAYVDSVLTYKYRVYFDDLGYVAPDQVIISGDSLLGGLGFNNGDGFIYIDNLYMNSSANNVLKRFDPT